MTEMSGSVSSHTIDGTPIRFFVANPHDVIQSHHSRGEFYEPEELAIIADFFPKGGVYVDIGCNVGNHLVYVCKFLRPMQAIVFEPNPPAIKVLQINIIVNGLERVVDLTYLGVGVSDVSGHARPVVPDENNLGGAYMQPTEEAGSLRLIAGDEALLQRRVDFIKIDVEGMEIRVLAGLAGTIAKWRPSMFIEVDSNNADEFDAWIRRFGYVAARTFSRHPHNKNYMIVPIESIGATKG